MGEREMEIDLSYLQVLAKTSLLVREGLLSLEVQSRPKKLPQIFWDKIQEMHGLGATLVLQKELRSSDVDPRQYRLSMPAKKIKAKFLTREESETLESQKGIPVSLIEPCLKVHHGLQLKRWMNDTVHFSYVLTKEWNDVAQFEQNGLKKDSPVQLWAFRVNGDLCFCLVNSKHPPAAADNYSVS
ncbi:hypothetical protein ACJRO7_009940 [Eucalyptus globulus]|uniref:B3 domain-containing protein n=1 Tax=Eucalyptus globulus TaxID=34317 RepID=A0ABD3LAG6_EUCGL